MNFTALMDTDIYLESGDKRHGIEIELFIYGLSTYTHCDQKIVYCYDTGAEFNDILQPSVKHGLYIQKHIHVFYDS